MSSDSWFALGILVSNYDWDLLTVVRISVLLLGSPFFDLDPCACLRSLFFVGG